MSERHVTSKHRIGVSTRHESQLPSISYAEFGGEDGDIEFSLAQEFHYDGDTSLFEDEETQQFYEKLSDLKATVPQILLKESQQAEESREPEEEELTDSKYWVT